MKRQTLEIVAVAGMLAVSVGPAHAIDLDGNGLGDIWEETYAIAPGAVVTEDWDHDGWDLIEESLLGTDPRDFQSGMRIAIEAIVSETELLLTLATQPGKRYQLETSIALTSWEILGPEITGAAAQDVELEVVWSPVSAEARFFRYRFTGEVNEDGDQLSAWEEGMLGTSDLLLDSDDDLLRDDWEFTNGFDPAQPYSLDPAAILKDGEFDSDGDGVPNNQDVDPLDTDTGRLTIEIDYPADGGSIE